MSQEEMKSSEVCLADRKSTLREVEAAQDTRWAWECHALPHKDQETNWTTTLGRTHTSKNLIFGG